MLKRRRGLAEFARCNGGADHDATLVGIVAEIYKPFQYAGVTERRTPRLGRPLSFADRLTGRLTNEGSEL